MEEQDAEHFLETPCTWASLLTDRPHYTLIKEPVIFLVDSQNQSPNFIPFELFFCLNDIV